MRIGSEKGAGMKKQKNCPSMYSNPISSFKHARSHKKSLTLSNSTYLSLSSFSLSISPRFPSLSILYSHFSLSLSNLFSLSFSLQALIWMFRCTRLLLVRWMQAGVRNAAERRDAEQDDGAIFVKKTISGQLRKIVIKFLSQGRLRSTEVAYLLLTQQPRV